VSIRFFSIVLFAASIFSADLQAQSPVALTGVVGSAEEGAMTPVTFWVGSNHGASIVKLEPLD